MHSSLSSQIHLLSVSLSKKFDEPKHNRGVLQNPQTPMQIGRAVLDNAVQPLADGSVCMNAFNAHPRLSARDGAVE